MCCDHQCSNDVHFSPLMIVGARDIKFFQMEIQFVLIAFASLKLQNITTY